MAREDLRQVSGVRPLWRSVQRALEDQIRSGLLAPGERLPTEEQLADHFVVHRNTVRRALERLREKRLVRVEQGRGTFVQESVVLHRLGPKARLSSEVLALGRETYRRVLWSVDTTAPADVARGLALPSSPPVTQVETLRSVDQVPVAVSSHFYPLPKLRGIETTIAATGSVSQALKSFGVSELYHQHSRIAARNPSAKDAGLLEQPKSRPVLYVVTVAADANGTPVQLTQTRFAGQWIELIMKYEM